VREELSLDYAPDAYSASQDREPSTDWFIEAQVAPKDISKIEQAVDQVVAEMAQGVTQNELDLVAKQLAVALEPIDDDSVQRVWFYTRYLIHGYGVEALTDVEAMTRSITKQEIDDRIQQIFGQGSVKAKYSLTPKP
jgi:zinc protease